MREREIPYVTRGGHARTQCRLFFRRGQWFYRGFYRLLSRLCLVHTREAEWVMNILYFCTAFFVAFSLLFTVLFSLYSSFVYTCLSGVIISRKKVLLYSYRAVRNTRAYSCGVAQNAQVSSLPSIHFAYLDILARALRSGPIARCNSTLAC